MSAPARRRAMTMVCLMLLASWTSMATLPAVSAHGGIMAEWGSEGNNDTGWLRMDATGANPANAQMAMSNLMLDFAPGAEISNLTFEVRVNGSNGTWIQEPQLILPDAPASILDWRGLGSFGQQNDFINGDPHTGRLSPNSDSNAGWVLPGGATVTDVVIEALRPADTFVTSYRFDLVIQDTAIHPDDGRLYIALENAVLQVDANNDPKMIHWFEDEMEPLDMTIDAAEGTLHITCNDGLIRVFSIEDSSLIGNYSSPFGDVVHQIESVGPGFLVASNGESLWQVTVASDLSSTWTNVATLATDGSPATALLVVSTDIWVGTDGAGLFHYGNGGLQQYDSQNALPSDNVVDLEMAGTYLLIGLADAGVARRDLSTGNWVATWNTGNWLLSDEVSSMSSISGWVHILAENQVYSYNTSSLSFSSSWSLSDLDLARSPGQSLIPWPSGGARAPMYDQVLVDDGSGVFTILHPQVQNHGAPSSPQQNWPQIVLASGPSVSDMTDAVELNGVLYIATDETIQRYNTTQHRWHTPLSPQINSAIVCIATDGTDLFVGTQADGIVQMSVEGTMLGSWDASDGLSADEVRAMAYDFNTNQIVAIHPFSGMSLVDSNSTTVNQTWTTNSGGLATNQMNAVVVRGGVAYLGTNNRGIERIDLVNSTRLSPWTSTGLDDLESMPIAIDGDTLYLGVYDYGVIVYNATSGEQVDLLQRRGQGGGSNQMPSNEVLSLAVISPGTVLVGTGDGGAQYTSNGWSNMGNTGNERADEFYDWDFDNQYIYAATETGVCQWSRSNLAFQKCWDDNPDGLPAQFAYSIELIEPGRIWVGHNEGAGVIDVTNDTVIKSWQAGVETNNANTVIIGDVAYIGYDGIGILRYDLTTDEWLSPWDSVNTNLIESNGVTAMVQDVNPNRIWVGGDMGLNLIDVVNQTLEEDWDSGSNPGGITLSNQEPAELVIVGSTLYYLQVRFGNNGYSSNDFVYRYDIVNMTQQSTLDVGATEGSSAIVHGMGAVGDIVHFGMSDTQTWWEGGYMVRWNHSSSSWLDSIEASGQVERVNAQFAGDCEPSPTNCHLYAAYGNTPLHQVDMNGNLVRSWDDSVIEGPIRGIVTWEGAVLFGTEDGVARYNYSSNTWLSEWTSNNGLPNNVQDAVYSMEVLGDDLWISTMATGGWNRNSKLLQLNGTTGQWTVHDVGSGQIPEGYGADFGICDDIVHVALNRWASWGSQGGVARYDLNSGTWLSDWNQGQNGLPHDNPVAIACDEAYDIVYIGFEEDDGSIARYDYVNLRFLAELDEDDNTVSDPIFPGAMVHFGAGLLVGHYDGGGLTYLGTTGQIVTSVIPFAQGDEATSIAHVPGGQAYEFAIGRAGGSSGYNRVDNLDVNGIFPGAWDNLATLSTGRIAEFTGNATHVWATPIDDYFSTYGSAILEGEYQTNGSIEWTRAWNLNAELVNEITLDGDILWITTTGLGLWQINLTTGAFTPTGFPLHGQMDGMAWYGNDLVVGLMGTPSTAAGVQRYDTSTGQWGAGKIAAGLPSNFVRDFEKIGDLVYIGTLAGIGVWNLSADDWEDPMTTADGLPTPFIEHLDSENGVLMIGTPAGMMSYDPNNGIGLLYGRNQGMVGDSVDGIAKITTSSGQTTLFISHNGEGPTRPGYSVVNPSTSATGNGFGFTVQDTTLIDVLPSNTVTAMASDWWGVHIATDEGPMMHWNGSNSEMEQGAPPSAFADWPVTQMASDGQTLLAISSFGVDRINPSGTLHPSIRLTTYAGLMSSVATSSGIYVVGVDGLHIWSPAPSFVEKDRSSILRADPLMINFGGTSFDVTSDARPGNEIVLVNNSNPVALPMFGTAGPGNIPMTQDMLTLSSPVSGAATWAASTRLNYSGTWDLASLDTSLENTVQTAILNSVLTPAGRSLHLQLQSPSNGSIEVRLTYDWVRSETPSEMVDLFDRPNDGGSVLTAQWTVTQDHSFTAYRIYLRPGSNWTTPPTALDLQSQTWDARLPDWQRVTADLNSHNGQPLVDGTPYWAVIVIEYPDGSIGEPSPPIGPATPTNEVPAPPAWASGGPVPYEEGGQDGDLFIEWAPCTELDASVTRFWPSHQPINGNPMGLPRSFELAHDAGNNTTLSPPNGAGHPFWVAFTCVDESGQHDPENATIIGPIVPTGGIDDGTAPLPIEDIAAWDTPDDEGGRINVSWTANLEEDCSWYTIYATPVVSDTPPDWADDAEVARIVVPCLQRNSDTFTVEVIMDEIAGGPLTDLMPYWITVVASDNWGNADHWNVTWVEAFSVQNTVGVDPPPRVEDLQAWDHPDDDGTAVDIQWTPSTVNDFDFYVVWASEHPLDNVAFKWMECEESPASCGLLVIQQQRQSWNGPMNIMLESALYGGNSLEESSTSEILPNQPIWVTVTIHDIKGNAFLTNLNNHMVLVTPVDNSGDVIAPDRLPEPLVEDRPDDSGDALLVTFDDSDASDLSHYEIYADTIPFTEVGSRSPAMIVERDGTPQFQPGGQGGDNPRPGGGRQADFSEGAIQDIVLTRLSNGQSIQPNAMVWVAVVPVDSSGNAWTTELNVATATPIDDSQTDPGLHLPEITGVQAEWNEGRSEITVTWDESRDAQVAGYIVHLSSDVYEDIRAAQYEFDLVQGTRTTLGPEIFQPSDEERQIDVNGTWYVSVVAFDGEVTRYGVVPVAVEDWTPGTENTEVTPDEAGSGEWWNDLSAMEISLIALLTLMIFLLSMIIVGRLRKSRYNPLDYATPNWELQVEDWGGDTYATEMSPEVDFQDTLMPAATSIRSTEASPTPSSSQIPIQMDDLESLAGDLLGETTSKKSEDPFNLDDIL
ncbi:MAG: hypothetical protein VYA86_02795 [Candidatus Thermoplasmatota archaeon]|nr:hypothetical protein [Candidatus Thermoplasmatota archaeon]